METKKFAVIGHPIGHTMSPFIHTRLFELQGVKAEYTKLDIAPEKLAAVIKMVANGDINRNAGKKVLIAVIENGGEPLACAFALFKGRKSVLLGAVATNPSARGRGYASRAVSLLANENSEKRVFLFCRNDGLADFYGKIGFETDGRWAVAVKS